MQITQEITMHLDRRQESQIVDAVQGETARAVTLALYDKDQPWTVPADASILIRYRKPDCTGGVYDSLSDGSRAWDIQENLVTVRIAPQALAMAGLIAMQIAIVAQGEELASFIFRLRVEADPSIGTLASDDYINIGQWLMPRIYQYVSDAQTAAALATQAADEARRTAAGVSSRYDLSYNTCCIDPVTGIPADNACAMVSNHFPLLNKLLGVAFSPLVTVRLFFYDSDLTYLGADLMRTESFEMDAPVGAAFARIEARYASGMEVANPYDLASYVTVYIPNTSAQDADRAENAASQAFMSADRANTAAQAAELAAKSSVKTVNGVAPDENGNVVVSVADGKDYVLTDADKQEIAALAGASQLPDYWQEHLNGKIAAIQALQEEGGKDCFSFVVLADPHYESNLGKCSPTLAKQIMDACGIRYCLCLGDMQTRHGAKHDEAYIENEWLGIGEMLSPIRDRLLITQGNHDGSYGWFDLNGDGVINDDVNGDGVADSYDKDVYNFTPQKLYERIFRKVSAMEGVHFSEDGTGYYADDTGSKVRYIILNSHVNKYELNEDGSVKYNNMYHFRFGQDQYDMVIEALSTVPSDGWSVIVASHVPLDRTGEYTAWGGQEDENGAQTGNPADCVVMMRLLNAYQNKTAYTGSFAGTQGGVANYTNLADTADPDWQVGQTTNSGELSANADRDVTNYIGDGECIYGRKLYFKNITPTKFKLLFYTADKSLITAMYPTNFTDKVGFDDAAPSEGYITLSGSSSIESAYYVRFAVLTGAENPIITLDEEIIESEAAFDAVSVDADFTDAKGTIISCHGGHVHEDNAWGTSYAWNGAEHSDFNIIATRCDGAEENDETLKTQRVAGTVTEQSFDVFTVNKATRKIYATKIGAGNDREISY